MSSIQTSGTQEDAQMAVFQYVRSLMPDDVPVILAQENDVDIPKPPFVIINPGRTVRLATNSHDYSVDGQVTLEQAAQVDMQVDTYGQGGADRMGILTTLWRDEHACDWFSQNFPDMAPLYAEQRQQVQFINEAQDYEERWTADLAMQVNQRITLPLESAIYPGPVIIEDIK